MGLTVVAKGMPCFDLAYSTYYRLRVEIVRAAYGEECRKIFCKERASNEEIAYWNSVCNDDLDIFLFHSDCDGRFTVEECRKILKALEPISIDMQGWDFNRNQCNMLNQWKNMFRHCVKRRVQMRYC